MRHKKKFYGNQYNKEYILWILQQFGGMEERSLRRDTENRKEKIAAIKGYLDEMSARKVIRDLPEPYQILCDCLSRESTMELDYEPVRISYKVSDQYMNDQVVGIYEKITVMAGWKGRVKRIHEAYAFHEFRHFVVRMLVRLGLY